MSKNIYEFAIITGILLLGCSSVGGTSIAAENVYVRVGPDVVADPARLEELKDRHTVETHSTSV